MARPSNRQAASIRELGVADVFHVSSLQFSDFELIEGWSGPEVRRQLSIMANRDETVGAMNWCITSTMGQVEWKHVPRVDGRDDDDDAEAVRMAEWCDGLLEDMAHTMQDHVEEALSMTTFGFAPCEIVLKRRDGVDSIYNDGLYGIAKLPLRDQLSVMDWLYQGNDAIGFRQQTLAGSATIPLWKTLHYRTTSRLDRPEGRPMLLNALRVWKLKEKIQDSEAIGIDRDLCGLPVFKIPEEIIEQANETIDDPDNPGTQILSPAAISARSRIAQAAAAVKDMRFNRSGGIVIPSDTYGSDEDSESKDRTPKWDFSLVTTAGQRSIDTRTAARDYDRAIARVCMMQFLHLGDRSTGSYAMSDDQSSMAVRSLMALALKIAKEWTKKLIPLIWEVNGFDKRYMPRLRATEISKDGITQIGALLAGLGKSVGLWEADVDMRMALAKLMNLPADIKAQQAAVERAAKAQEKLGEPDPAPIVASRPKPVAANANKNAVGDDDENSD